MKQYFKNSWLGIWTVLVGMKITFKHLFTHAVTIQYPDVKVPLPESRIPVTNRKNQRPSSPWCIELILFFAD